MTMMTTIPTVEPTRIRPTLPDRRSARPRRGRRMSAPRAGGAA